MSALCLFLSVCLSVFLIPQKIPATSHPHHPRPAASCTPTPPPPPTYTHSRRTWMWDASLLNFGEREREKKKKNNNNNKKQQNNEHSTTTKTPPPSNRYPASTPTSPSNKQTNKQTKERNKEKQKSDDLRQLFFTIIVNTGGRFLVGGIFPSYPLYTSPPHPDRFPSDSLSGSLSEMFRR